MSGLEAVSPYIGPGKRRYLEVGHLLEHGVSMASPRHPKGQVPKIPPKRKTSNIFASIGESSDLAAGSNKHTRSLFAA